MEEIRQSVKDDSTSGATVTPIPMVTVRIGNIVWGVFWGMWLFAISAAIIVALFRLAFGI